MKKMIMALMMVSFIVTGAEAKKKCVCTSTTKHTTATAHKTVKAGYTKGHDAYAENFKVCKAGCGYTICGETPTTKNTAPAACAKVLQQQDNNNNVASNGNNDYDESVTVTDTRTTYNYNQAQAPEAVTPMAPVNQSFAVPVFNINTISSFEGYYPNKGKIEVIYDDTNNARAPYQGKPSPQDDGPSKNNYRNLNSNQPDLPPINGEIK